jgi:hypothetical protein
MTNISPVPEAIKNKDVTYLEFLRSQVPAKKLIFPGTPGHVNMKFLKHKPDKAGTVKSYFRINTGSAVRCAQVKILNLQEMKAPDAAREPLMPVY